MKNKQTTTFKNATGKIDYTLMNDCMFHSVMTQNGNVLKGLVCALLRLKPDRVHSITVLNPYELGSDIRDKNFILDIKILLNDRKVINIELQVRSQRYWNDRSLIYLCRLFDNLEKGSPYSDVMPAYHISIREVLSSVFVNFLIKKTEKSTRKSIYFIKRCSSVQIFYLRIAATNNE